MLDVILKAMEQLEKGEYKEFNKCEAMIKKPITWLYFAEKDYINLEHVGIVPEGNNKSVYFYTKRTLTKLKELMPSTSDAQTILALTLLWSDVSKGGSYKQRKAWQSKNYALSIHNEASAFLFNDHCDHPYKREIFTLIYTHGLIGQAVRGECSLSDSLILNTMKGPFKDPLEAKTLLFILNNCIISAVSESLWHSVRLSVIELIDRLFDNSSNVNIETEQRLKALRYSAILKGEDQSLYENYHLDKIYKIIERYNFWYAEAALGVFSFEEFSKVYLFIDKYIQANTKQPIRHISFEKIMNDIFYNYKGRKTCNIYKKRIIEHFLKMQNIDDLQNMIVKKSEHIRFEIMLSGDVCSFSFKFSKAVEQLISFCEEAEKTSSVLFEKSIILLYDLFGFRKDEFDWFHNEEAYLETMNGSIKSKEVLIDHIVGDKIVDVGPGGGALMDAIEERYPEKQVIGLDVSKNVVETLEKRKVKEGKKWVVKEMDILDISHSDNESFDSIIFCSILHELYSYVPYNGQKFNKQIIKDVLANAFKLLNHGGRILIRDGIMSDKDELVKIHFKKSNGPEFFSHYVKDFKGRVIDFSWIDEDTVLLKNNDAMEFLYTYTWGKESYPREVQEQFGYFTLNEFKECIVELFGNNAKIIKCESYLQEGYAENLETQIDYLNNENKPIRLPDSTCLIIIEKV